MSDELNPQPPLWFYLIAGLFLVWNFAGWMLYYQQMTLTPEMLASLDPAKAAFLEATPVWATSAYAIAVTAGTIACVLLLLRKSWAVPAFMISLAGVLVQDLDSFVLRDVVAVFGSDAYIVPSLVVVIAVLEIGYARSIANRYYR